MTKFRDLFKNRTAIVVMLLCVAMAVGLYFWDQNRVRKHANNPNNVWTVTMDNEVTPYTFRGPLDMFLIHYSEVTSLRHLTAEVSSLTMEWHYETGQPWRRWERENPKKTKIEDRVKLSASADIVAADSDRAAHAESIHLDHVINNPNPAVNAKPMGKVWNNTALKFERRSGTYYLIEEREPYDGRVIICSTGAWYCSLEGARVNDTLELDHVLVWKEDVMNWKQYQNKAQSLIQQVIVE